MIGIVLGSILLYAGAGSTIAGLFAFAWGLVRPRPGGGKRAWLMTAAGAALAGTAWLLPARETGVASARSRLDEFAPVYQFHEVHSIRVRAPAERVFEAVKSVTAGEILLFRTLTWIRRFGRPGPESILRAPERMPLLEVATRTSFLLLAEEPGREVVVGTIVIAPPGIARSPAFDAAAYRELARSGFAKATMNFRIESAGAGESLLTTETRVFATDDSTKRRFAAYWRVIYPGSALIRRFWLRAIRLRAEARAAGPQLPPAL